MQAIVKAKKIGGSVGVIIPREIVEKEHIKPEDTVEIKVKRKDSLESIWGILKDIKKPTQQIMKEIDEGEESGY